MFKNQKGITLIALVITIIVLLILAGITIALITSNDSAPSKATEAKIMQDVGAAKDSLAIKATELTTTYYENKYVTPTEAGKAFANAVAYITNQESALEAAGTKTDVTSATFTAASGSDAAYITVESSATANHNGTVSKYVQVGTFDDNGGITWGNQEGSTDGWVAAN